MARNPNTAPMVASHDIKKARRRVGGGITYKRAAHKADRRAAKQAVKAGNYDNHIFVRCVGSNIS